MLLTGHQDLGGSGIDGKHLRNQKSEAETNSLVVELVFKKIESWFMRK
jgi:hypothetical protein